MGDSSSQQEAGTPASPEAAEGTSTTSTSSGDNLDSLVRKLEEQLHNVTSEFEDAQAAAEGAKKQQKLVQADLALLKRATSDFIGARDEASKRIEEAQKARSAAQGLIDTLADDDKDRVQADLDKIDQWVTDAEAELWGAEDKLAELQLEEADLRRKVEEKQEAFDRAFHELSQLPAAVRRLAAPLQALTRDMKAATDAAQPQRAFLIAEQIQRSVEKVEGQLGDDVLSERIDAYTQALADLDDARHQQAPNAEALAQQKKEVTAKQKAVADAVAKRAEDLKKLAVPPTSSGTPTAASA